METLTQPSGQDTYNRTEWQGGVRPATNKCDELLRAFLARLPIECCGIEIGAHELPVPGLKPYYVDRVTSYAGSEARVDVLADALALPIPTGALDYLCASHVLEHLVNPIAALFEWHRALRPGGLLYLVVPDKRYTFDQPRHVTTAEHLLRDFLRGTVAGELEHVHDFIYHTDWERLRPGTPAERKADDQKVLFAAYARDVASGLSVDIHHHTFVPSSLLEMLRLGRLIEAPRAGFELIGTAERFPTERGDGIGLVLRKRGGRNMTTPETFQFRVPGRRWPIPLVCPCSLVPLQIRRDSTREVLTTADGRHRYRSQGAIPDLLPPPGSRVNRWWSNRLLRRLWCTRFHAVIPPFLLR